MKFDKRIAWLWHSGWFIPKCIVTQVDTFAGGRCRRYIDMKHSMERRPDNVNGGNRPLLGYFFSRLCYRQIDFYFANFSREVIRLINVLTFVTSKPKIFMKHFFSFLQWGRDTFAILPKLSRMELRKNSFLASNFSVFAYSCGGRRKSLNGCQRNSRIVLWKEENL